MKTVFPEAYYLKKVRESHESKLKSKGLNSSKIKLSGSGPVLSRLRQCFDKLKVDFNKESAGKLIRKDLIRRKSVDTLPDGVVEKSETLLIAVRNAFGTSDE